jgi:tetratricopeptide (TPR) repeat protein
MELKLCDPGRYRTHRVPAACTMDRMGTATVAALLFLQANSVDAVSLFKQHKYAEAAAAFEKAVARDGEHSDTVILLGQSYYLAGKYGPAIPWLRKAVKSGAHPAEAAYMLGTACLFTQQPDEAVAAFADVFGVEANSAAAHLATAEMMVRQELLDYASTQIGRALELDPRIPQAHYLAGVIALAHADTERAIEELRREIVGNPNFAMSYYRMGDAYVRREEWAWAVPQLQRSIWLNPAFTGPYILLGKAYLKMGDLVNAEGILRHAVQMDPRSRQATYLLGQTLLGEDGKKEEGRKLVEHSLELKDNSP